MTFRRLVSAKADLEESFLWFLCFSFSTLVLPALTLPKEGHGKEDAFTVAMVFGRARSTI